MGPAERRFQRESPVIIPVIMTPVTAPAPGAALGVLLGRLIDYAGLFPPAALAMGPAVAEYEASRRGPDAWALGRFVLPAARLTEFADAAAAVPTARGWTLSVLLGEDLSTDLTHLEQFRVAQDGGTAHVVDAVEFKAGTVAAVYERTALVPPRLARFVEIPVQDDPLPLVEAIAHGGAAAKIRTGGVTTDAFPSPEQVVRFVRACAQRHIAFKATAGLHHPLRGQYPLTYAPDSAAAPMYGYLNVFLVAAFVRRGLDDAAAVRLLVETDADAFTITDAGILWGGHTVTVADLADTRRHAALGFGSCSFREPLDDLRALRLL